MRHTQVMLTKTFASSFAHNFKRFCESCHNIAKRPAHLNLKQAICCVALQRVMSKDCEGGLLSLPEDGTEASRDAWVCECAFLTPGPARFVNRH